MARADWVALYIPKEMHDKLKELSSDPTFRAKGFTNPKELAVNIIRDWLTDHS